MRQLIANVAVVMATTAALAFLIPQIVKLVRTRDSKGVSASWPAIGLVSNTGWVVYVVHEGLWAAILAPTGTAIGYGVTLWALARTGRDLRPSLWRGLGAAMVLVAITTAVGWPALGVALALSYAVMLTPSLWTAYRTPDPSGVSPGTWRLGVTEGFLWGVYGWHHADAGIVTFAFVGILGSSLMLARYAATRAQSPSPEVASARNR